MIGKRMKTRNTNKTVITSLDASRREHESFEALFKPKTVAVIGATDRENSVGLALMKNLTSTFKGNIYPINPKREMLLGLRAFPAIADAPERIDLAVIVTPATTVPDVIGECIASDVKSAIVISAGFKETGAKGIELERQVLEKARAAKMRFIGPNCLGVMNTRIGLNATFADKIALPGSVAFISQSGALCTAILDWSYREKVGFSHFVSVGSMLDVGWGDLIDYLGDDPGTESIVMYMETIGDARAFMSAAREVALRKPIIVIKAGRSQAAAKAAASHTGSLSGSDDAIDAAFHRCGVLRVNTISDLFAMAEVIGKQPRPKGNRLTIVTNAGGPAVLATDVLTYHGGELATLSETSIQKLNTVLPDAWSHGNPVDILGDATADRYMDAIDIVGGDPNSDGLLVILTPQAMTQSTETARQLAMRAEKFGKPVLASWMGAASVREGEDVLNNSRIPTYGFPDTAARVFDMLWQYSDNLRSLYETPNFADNDVVEREHASKMIDGARGGGRTLLTEYESKQLLAMYGIPTVPTVIAKSADEAVVSAQQFGFPIVLKLHSTTITHKTDVGGVKLNLQNADEVRAAFHEIETSVRALAGEQHFHGVSVQPMVKLRDGYELILGCSLDTQLGPVLLFGSGGQLVEVFKDSALGLPPLTTTLARQMIEQTRIYEALKGVRGRDPVDMASLEKLLVRFSQLVVEQRWIKEIDINPLVVSSEKMIALDARVVLHEPNMQKSELPRLAIRPYPNKYVSPFTLSDGVRVIIRPIRPEDEPKMIEFHKTLSDESIYLRYFHHIPFDERIAHERLARICFNDYDRELALVAERCDENDNPCEIRGVGRLIKLRGGNKAEFAILISDQYQHQGLGRELLSRLVQFGRDEGLSQIVADILPDNTGMIRVSKQVGFTTRYDANDQLVKAEIML
jgi:acetyltransferase